MSFCKEGANTADTEARKAIYDEFQMVFIDEMPIIPLYRPLRLAAINNRAQNASHIITTNGLLRNIEDCGSWTASSFRHMFALCSTHGIVVSKPLFFNQPVRRHMISKFLLKTVNLALVLVMLAALLAACGGAALAAPAAMPTATARRRDRSAAVGYARGGRRSGRIGETAEGGQVNIAMWSPPNGFNPLIRTPATASS